MAGKVRKTKKQSDILQAAEHLILKKGIKSVTVEEITQQAQVSKATFYKYYTDKQDVLRHVLFNIGDELVERLTKTLQKGKSDGLTEEAFFGVFDLDEYSHVFQSDFAKELLEDYPQVMKEFTEASMSKVYAIFHELVRMAKIDGIIRVDIDAEIFLIYTFSIKKAMQQALMENPQITNRIGVKEYIRKVHDMVLYGIAEKKKT